VQGDWLGAVPWLLPGDRQAVEFRKAMRVARVFAGIGGLRIALARKRYETALLCEIDPVARAVLRRMHLSVLHAIRLPLRQDVEEPSQGAFGKTGETALTKALALYNQSSPPDRMILDPVV
jgi:hypothetical protein